MDDVLAWLLHPLRVSEFNARYLEQTCLHTSHGAGYFDGLISAPVLDDALARLRFTVPQVRMAQAGVLQPEAFTLDGLVVDPARVAARVAAGATLVMDGAHHWHAPLGALCRTLAQAVRGRAWANVYFTPRGAQGFPAHADDHDVFVLQVAGTKAWSLHQPPREIPPRGAGVPRGTDHGPVVRTLAMAPGDLLYIPRGHGHAAAAQDDPTLHVTLGVALPTWEDVLAAGVRTLAARDARLHRVVPPGPLKAHDTHGRTPDAAAHLEALLAALHHGTDLDAALTTLAAEHTQAQRSHVPGGLLAAAEGQAMTATTVVGVRPGLWHTVAVGRHTVTVSVPGRVMELPRHAARAVRYALGHARFAVRDLPGLDEDGQLTLARRLVAEGVLQRVAGDDAPGKRGRTRKA